MAKEKERPKRSTPRTHTDYNTVLKKLQQGQKRELLVWLLIHGSITQKEALESLGIMRLSGRIYELRDMDVNITTLMIPVVDRHGETKHVAKYVLDEEGD